MHVTVLYFAALRDLVGRSEERLALPEEVTTVRRFLEHLARHEPVLAARLPFVRIARNEVFASADEPITDGDVLALIPPVAGG
jgi:molybdopterin converting factor subunit 1